MITTTTDQPGIVIRLQREWDCSWATELYDFPHRRTTAGEVLAQVRSLPGAEADALMLQLLIAAGRGDQRCSRTALQVMLPKCVSLARSCRGLRRMDPQEAMGVVVAIMWEKVTTYPVHRTRHVIGNLAMDALKTVTRKITIPSDSLEVSLDPVVIEEVVAGEESSDGTEQERCFTELLTVMGWACDHNVLSQQQVSVLTRYSTGTKEERSTLADELGVSTRNLCRKVSAIRCNLAKALREHAVERGDLTDLGLHA